MNVYKKYGDIASSSRLSGPDTPAARMSGAKQRVGV
jgi:hypothetical protein